LFLLSGAIFGALCASRATSFVRAAGRSILLLQVPLAAGGWPAAERRTVAELGSMGFDVDVLPLPIAVAQPSGALGFSNAWGTWAGQAAAQRSAIAVVSVTRVAGAGDRETVVATILDRVTGKTTTRQIGASVSEPPANADSAALLAVELLYSSLLEIEVPHPSRGELPPPTVVTSLVREQRLALAPPRFGGHIGTSVSVPSGDMSAQPGLAGGISYFQQSWLATTADLRVGAVPAPVSAGDASARVGWATGRLQLLALAWPRGTVTLFLGAGVGWLLAWARGSSVSGIPTSTSVGGSFLMSAGAGLGARLRPNLRLRLSVDPTVLATPLRVRFGGVEVAHLGRFMLDGMVALEWLWR